MAKGATQMKLEMIRENEDGSADFTIEDLTPEQTQAFVRLGIIKALEDGIKEAQSKYNPDVEDFEDEGS
jgi:hypothetical protein